MSGAAHLDGTYVMRRESWRERRRSTARRDVTTIMNGVQAISRPRVDILRVTLLVTKGRHRLDPSGAPARSVRGA